MQNTPETHDVPDGPTAGTSSSGSERDTDLLVATKRSPNRTLLVALAGLLLVAVLGVIYWTRDARPQKGARGGAEPGAAGHEAEEKGEEGEADVASEVALSAEALEAGEIEIESVTQRVAVGLLRVTGTVEANQQQTQQATTLVAGRVERVNVALGDAVRAGSVLAVISSPEIAELHGKLHEAETRVALAERSLERVQRAENRVAVLSAKAKLDEAEATLRRTRRLVEIGAGAGKDLIAAETAYKTAKAEYDFQSNIALNKDLLEARAELETARVDVSHMRDQLGALGAELHAGSHEAHRGNTAVIPLRAPVSGTVTERLVNAGAGVESGETLFTISNLSTVWVIANVPESKVGLLRVGAPAEVRSNVAGGAAAAGRVSYVDSRLDESSRTARVRVEVANAAGRFKAGMFVEVGFHAGANAGESAEEQELVVPATAVHRVGERTVVFVPEEDEPGHFKVQDVEVGGEIEGYRRVISGLELGEQVVTKGSFALKTQLMKGELGEDED